VVTICRHCGGRLRPVEMGKFYRWVHYETDDVWCRITTAAPDRRRKVRNRYALRRSTRRTTWRRTT